MPHGASYWWACTVSPEISNEIIFTIANSKEQAFKRNGSLFRRSDGKSIELVLHFMGSGVRKHQVDALDPRAEWSACKGRAYVENSTEMKFPIEQRVIARPISYPQERVREKDQLEAEENREFQSWLESRNDLLYTENENLKARERALVNEIEQQTAKDQKIRDWFATWLTASETMVPFTIGANEIEDSWISVLDRLRTVSGKCYAQKCQIHGLVEECAKATKEIECLQNRLRQYEAKEAAREREERQLKSRRKILSWTAGKIGPMPRPETDNRKP